MIPVQLIAEMAKRGTDAGAAIAPVVAGAMTKGARLENKEFKDLVKRAKQNRYGLSDAAQRQMVAQTTGDVQAQQRAATAEAARAFAAPGTQSGQAQMALAQSQQQTLGAAQAQARGAARAVSEQVAQQQRARTSELGEKRRARVEKATADVAGALAGAGSPKEAEAAKSGGGGGGGGGGFDLSSVMSMFGKK